MMECYPTVIFLLLASLRISEAFHVDSSKIPLDVVKSLYAVYGTIIPCRMGYKSDFIWRYRKWNVNTTDFICSRTIRGTKCHPPWDQEFKLVDPDPDTKLFDIQIIKNGGPKMAGYFECETVGGYYSELQKRELVLLVKDRPVGCYGYWKGHILHLQCWIVFAGNKDVVELKIFDSNSNQMTMNMHNRYDMDNDPDGLIELTHTVTLEEDYPAGNHIFYGRIYTRGKKLLNVHTFSILIVDERFSTTAYTNETVHMTSCKAPYVIKVVRVHYWASSSMGQGKCCPHPYESVPGSYLNEIQNKCNGKQDCEGLVASGVPEHEYVEINYSCYKEEFGCEDLEIVTKNDAIFKCHRKSTISEFLEPSSIMLENSMSRLAVENAKMVTWFEDLTHGRRAQYYQINISDLITGSFYYQLFHVPFHPTPLASLRVDMDKPFIREDGQPFDKVLHLGGVGQELQCTIQYPGLHYPDLGMLSLLWLRPPGNVCCVHYFTLNSQSNCFPGYDFGMNYDLSILHVTYGNAGQYICQVDHHHLDIEETYSAQVMVAGPTLCPEVYSYLGEMVYISCSVTYSGTGTALLQITDMDGNRLQNIEPMTEGFSEGSTIYTKNLTISVDGLLQGIHTFFCNTSFPGFFYEDYGCTINVTIDSPVDGADVETSGKYHHEGDNATFKCTTKYKELAPAVHLTWLLNGEEISNGRRFGIEASRAHGRKEFVSTLSIWNMQPSDTGILECKVSIESHQNISSRTTDIYVLARPSVMISNYSYTLTEGEDISLRCVSTFEQTGHPNDTIPATILWYKNNVEIKPGDAEKVTQLSHNISMLMSVEVKEDEVYSCAARNEAGSSSRKSCHVYAVPKESYTCPRIVTDGLVWPETAGGEMISLPCPEGATGYITRPCSTDGIWDPPNTQMCVDKTYDEILDKINDIEDGLGVNVNKTEAIAKDLVETTVGNNISTSDPIKPGNLNASLEAVETLGQIHTRLDEPPSQDEVLSIVETCSIIIDKKNRPSWEVILQKNYKRGTSIMATLDNYADSLAKLIGGIKHSQESYFDTKNIVLVSDTWDGNNGSLTYPKRKADNGWSDETSDYITIDNETLSRILGEIGTQVLAISSIYYKTLDGIVPNKTGMHESDDYENEIIGSKVLAIGITNMKDRAVLKNPLQVYFQNNEPIATDEHMTECNYWDFTAKNGGAWSTEGCRVVQRNKSGTKCECDHMTNFAVLVAMHRPTGSLHQILSIMSVVGCSMSIICMGLTTATYAILWKPLQSFQKGGPSRSISVISLCSVLTLANVIFLTAEQSINPKGLCITIAAFLHYLFLSAFGIMLVSSINLYLKITSLTRGCAPDSGRRIIGFGCGALVVPAVIVATTLMIVGPDHYINGKVCWLSVEQGVLFSFVGPIVLVVLINSVITAVVLFKSLSSKATGLHAKSKVAKPLEMAKSALWTIAVLTPIMGTTWIIGVFAFDEKTVVFQFIFVILNSSQGIFIFVFYCLVDGSIKEARIKRSMDRKVGSRTEIISAQTDMCSDNTGLVRE